MADPKRIITSADMRVAVRERYGRSAAVFDEVGDSTGYRGERRRADCVVMGLWPSRGLHLEGIEIKVSRSDWIAELKSPEKADAIGKFVDFWWLAIADEKIVKDGELPANWGLLVLDGKTLKVVKSAPQLQPEPLDRGFVAAILRRAAEAQDEIRRNARHEGIKEGAASAPEIQRREQTAIEQDLEALRESVTAFEAASGIKIGDYNGGNLGEVVAKIQRLQRFGNEDPTKHLETAASALEMFAKGIREEKAKLAKELKLVAALPVAEEREVANG